MTDVNNRFQIFSLDGGGIKGLFSAAILAAIESDLGVKVIDHFDLIAGTSTGGIIAIALGLGISPKDIVKFYVEEGPKIFDNGLARDLRSWVANKHSPFPLRKALFKYFENRRLGDSSKRLVIPSFDLGSNDVYIFKTAHHEKLRRDFKLPAWQVAMATSAAPTYFPSFTDIDNIRMIDGGIWANNPVVVAIAEATGILGTPLDSVHALSVGTTDEIFSDRKHLDSGGKFLWADSAKDVLLAGQSIAATNQAKLLLTKDRFTRLSESVAKGLFELDRHSDSRAIIAKAAKVSREFSPIFKARFEPHRAKVFSPIHS